MSFCNKADKEWQTGQRQKKKSEAKMVENDLRT